MVPVARIKNDKNRTDPTDGVRFGEAKRPGPGNEARYLQIAGLRNDATVLVVNVSDVMCLSLRCSVHILVEYFAYL